MRNGIIRRAAPKTVVWLTIALLAIWFSVPMLSPVHVEGFSASIGALGLHLSRHTVSDFLPSAPFNADYFGLTKFGMVLGVAALSPWLGVEAAMHGILTFCIALVFAASAWLVRRWSGLGWEIAVAVLLILPGVAESGYFFNDNVPAVGMLLLAFMLLARRPELATTALSGLLIGCAISARTDMMFVAVVAVPLIASQTQGLRAAAITTAIAGSSAVAMLFAIYAVVGATPLDALHAGTAAVALWGRPLDPLMHIRTLIYFCGLPGFALILLGATTLRGEPRNALLLVGVPLFFNLLLLGKMWQTRQLLPLTPFMGALAARGTGSLIVSLRSGRFGPPVAVGLLTLFALVGPETGLTLSDGPRLLTGRLAGITLWKDWQGAVRADFTRIDAAIRAVPAHHPVAIMTDGWNDDRYLHLRLIEQGFQRTALPPACAMIGEALSRGTRTVVQLSLRHTFVPYADALQGERLERGALPCLRATGIRQIVLLAQQERVKTLLGRDLRQDRLRQDLRDAGVNDIVAVPLQTRDITALDQAYRRLPGPYAQHPSLDQAQAAVASRFAFSR